MLSGGDEDLRLIAKVGPKEGAQRQALQRYERILTSLDHERVYLIKLQGEVFSKDGRQRTIEFSESDMEHFPDSILTHSHPNAFPFSNDDIGIAVVFNLRELRAVARRTGSRFVLNRPDRGWPNASIVREALNNADIATDEELYERSLRGLQPLSDYEIAKIRSRKRRKFLPDDLKRGNV